MSTLQDLPTELLSQIFSYLASDTQLLRNLALECHCFSLAIRPVLLRNMTLTVHEEPSILKLLLLSRTLTENPEIGTLTQSLSLDMLRVEQSVKCRVHLIVKSLLFHFSALRNLKIQDNSEPPRFILVFWEWDPNSIRLTSLTSLTISDGNLTLQSMIRYMFLGNLKHLNVLWIQNPNPPTFDLLGWGEANWSKPRLLEGKKAGTSPVELLDFGPIFHLPAEIFEEILSWPKALQRFRGTIPGKDVPGRFGVSKHLSTTLSPTSISRALSPTKDSLRNLELIDIGCQWPGHDQSKMDLSDFKSLTRIDVPSTCFFKAFTYGVKKNGMYTLLPPSLVDLRIMYDLDDCIRPDEEERAAIPAHTHTVDDLWKEFHNIDIEGPLNFEFLNLETPKDLRWLLELAENKRDHFPNLRQVSLMERCGLLRTGIHPMNWKLPSTIQNAFDDAGIDFRAVMRTVSPVPT